MHLLSRFQKCYYEKHALQDSQVIALLKALQAALSLATYTKKENTLSP